ncbi:cell division protein FtsZ [Gammaproteobacteria bacterium]|nr:cell division protein FtsZ [Gammaproteobacteria bacterium]
MSFELVDTKEQKADIKVVGVGGCGNNAIEYMIKNKVSGVDFICVNTDAQDLKNNPVSENRKCNIGSNITRGLGAGANPEIGRQAAIEDKDKLKEAVQNCDMLFITAGMGGGTGTGASPVIAEIAKELGILTVAIVTKPWEYEKKKRMRNAENGIEELRNKVDSLIIIPNDKLCTDDDMPLSEAKNQSNAVLERAVRGIAELITKPGEINLDFADVKSVMANAGSTMMGSGIGEGVDRAEDAILQAIASPLLEDVDVKDAKGLLINITSNGSLTNGELRSIGDHIGSLVDEEEAEVILGTTIDESLENKLKVTVVATGMSNGNTIKEDMESKVDIVIDPKINSKEIVEMQLNDKKEIMYGNNQASEENKYDHADHDLSNYVKQDEYKINEVVEEKKDSKMIKQNNIQHKKNSNGELDLDFLDIPAFLRKQAD